MAYLLKITALLIIFINSVYAYPSININTQYYSIQGTTAKKLRNEMISKSSIKQSGNTYDASTSWFVSWHFNWYENNGKCKISKVKSSVKVKFTFPMWSNHHDSSFKLKKHWDRYYKALIDHENGHKKFGINAAKEVEKQLLSLSSKTCSALEKKANKKAQIILNKYYILEKKYDESTNHGMNNGAIFP